MTKNDFQRPVGGPSVKDPVFLGTDSHGFTYWLDSSERYVYQKYSVRKDVFKDGKNMRGQWNGWICDVWAWNQAMHRLVSWFGAPRLINL